MRINHSLMTRAIAALMLVALSLGAAHAAERTVSEFRLRYMQVDASVVDAVGKALTPEGRVTALATRNALIVSDAPEGMERARRLIELIDRRQDQVAIEASIVEVSAEYGRELGIKWSGGYSRASDDVLGRFGSTSADLSVNLPSSQESGLTFGIGAINDRVSLDLQISALESQGKARVISSPRVQVMDNQRATITEGTEIVIPSSTASTVINTGDKDSDLQSVYNRAPQIFSANLQLDVVPRIVEGEGIALAIDVRQEQFDYNKEVQGYPAKKTKSARTNLLVAAGSTIVIGGINTTYTEETEEGVPVLRSIPFIGRLFSHTVTSTETRELMIFLTPRVVKEGSDADKRNPGDTEG